MERPKFGFQLNSGISEMIWASNTIFEIAIHGPNLNNWLFLSIRRDKIQEKQILGLS